MADPVRYDVRGGVATITFDRAEQMNSLDVATKDALLAAIDRAAADAAVRAVVVTGTGRAFCVGQDLREHAEALDARPLEDVWSTVEQHYSPIARGLAEMPKPVIAAVNGVAAGAGMSIALACDLRVASDTAGFNTAFTAIGLSCDTGSSWTLPRLVGSSRAAELLLLPRTVKADEALAIGLVHRVVPADELADAAAALAAQLAAGPTRAYASVKASLAFAATRPLSDALDFEATMMAETGASEDHRNAVQSFVAKEKPSFEGR